MLDLFAGRLGWETAFLERGWDCVAVDLIAPPTIPARVTFVQADVRDVVFRDGQFWVLDRPLGIFDFGCGSSPCEKFAVFGMTMFHPNPPYPHEGIQLFNHARWLFESAGIPYVLENVRPAWKFVGPEANRCGPYALWGKGTPPLMPQGITKGFGAWNREQILQTGSSKSKRRIETQKAKSAIIPPELSHCVAEYAERLLQERTSQ